MKVKGSIQKVLLLLLMIGLIGCSANNTTSEQEQQPQAEQEGLVSLKTPEEIVGKNGYVFQRGERNYELQDAEDFNKILETHEKVFVIFYATWCPYCADLDERMPEILEERPDIVVLNVDIDNYADIANSYQAFSTPTVVYIQKNKQPLGFKGALPNEMIFEFLEYAENEEM